jgi:hypothetical protein
LFTISGGVAAAFAQRRFYSTTMFASRATERHFS